MEFPSRWPRPGADEIKGMEGSLQRRRAIDLEFMVELDCIPGFTKEVDGNVGWYTGNI